MDVMSRPWIEEFVFLAYSELQNNKTVRLEHETLNLKVLHSMYTY